MPLCMHLSNPECCQQGVQACSQFSHLLAGTGSFACSLARLLTIITYGHYIAVNLMGHMGLLLDRGRNALALFNNLPGSLKNGRQSRLYLRSEEHTSELQSRPHLVCRLLLEKKKY